MLKNARKYNAHCSRVAGAFHELFLLIAIQREGKINVDRAIEENIFILDNSDRINEIPVTEITYNGKKITGGEFVVQKIREGYDTLLGPAKSSASIT